MGREPSATVCRSLQREATLICAVHWISPQCGPFDDMEASGVTPSMTSVERVLWAQDFFRFAYLVGSPISFGMIEFPDAPEHVIFGKHSLTAKDFEMPKENFVLCGTLLERLAYRLLAMELNSALEKKYGSWQARRNHVDELIRNSSVVVWMIRNAVAQDILEPVWMIDDPTLQNKQFSAADVFVFDTTGLSGNLLNRFDFGEPIARFSLSEKLLPLLS